MCHDGNSATQSVRYLNAQVISLYQNAADCVESCGTLLNFKSEEYDKTKYSRSLAQYHYIGPKPKQVISTQELFFFANFAAPKVTFICNHEAILYLTIKDGHYNTEFSKADVAGSRLKPSKNKAISDVTFAFRVKFTRTGLKGSHSKIGNGSSHLIQLMILDFGNARLASIHPSQSNSQQEAMSFYMRSYLDFLEHAGHHVLFDLPDFDDDKYSPTIDYSVSSTLEDVERLCSNELVHGIDPGDLNNFLHKTWLSLARLGHPKDQLSIALAEISSAWLLNASIDTKFHIQFGPPKVRALCGNEVILTFDLEKIAFFKGESVDSGEPEEYSDWKISFIVDVKEEKEADGATTTLKLDLSTARFSHHFSRVSDTTEITLAYFYQIVQFLSVDYLDILVQYAMNVVYHIDVRVVVGRGGGEMVVHHHHEHSGSETDLTHESDDGEWKDVPQDGHPRRKHGHVVLYSERVRKTVMHGYDQILAVSEESINQLFWSMWTRGSRNDGDILSKWKHELFSAQFGAPKIRLLSNGKAIMWIHVNEGSLHVKSECERKHWWNHLPWSPATTSDKTEAHHFNDLSLAFEVDLKMVEQKALDLHDSWFHKFKSSQIYQCHHDVQQKVFTHLILDLAHAVYKPELSNIDCLCQGKGRMVVDKLETAIRYITTYLGHLAFHGHHVIHSIPIFDDHAHSPFALTSVAHHVVTKSKITLSNCAHARKGSESPVILIMGMCGGRELTFVPLHWIPGWVIAGKGKKSSLGTICLSREAFLEGTLLRRLADINAMTTIVPNFAGVIDGEWNFDLTTWGAHSFRKNKVCKWKPDGSHDGYLQYVWDHRDGWSHEHEGSSGDGKNAEYSIACSTHNKLHIPTTYHPGTLEIVLSGKSTLTASGKDANQQWRKKSTASWKASICIYSRSNGLHIEVTGSTKPVFSDLHSEGDNTIDFGGLHSQHMPQMVNFDRVIDELKSALQGTWEYSSPGHHSYALSNPVFTPNGDLILQLASYEAMMKKEIAAPSTPVRKPQMYIKAPSFRSSKDAGLHTASTPGDSPSLLTPLLEFVSHAQPSQLFKSATTTKTETVHHETTHQVEITELNDEIVY